MGIRVVITNNAFRLYWISRLKRLNQALRRRGDELTIVEISHKGSTYDFAKEEKDTVDEVKWLRLFEGSLKSLSPTMTSAALCDTLDELDPDVVMAGAIASTPGATAIRWCRRHRRPVIIMDDARKEDVPRSSFVNYVKRRIYRNVDAMLIPAPSHRLSYIEWGMRGEQLFYGLDVVDNEWFAQKAAEAQTKKDTWHQKYGLPERFFLSVGRQVPKKNWATLLTAYKEYHQNVKSNPWGFVLVGDGPDRRNLERQVREEEILDVRFVPFLSQEDLCRFYALCSVLILPSFYGETWGLVINEAMACGVPVLVSKECGCGQSLVKPGENGWTFSPRDSKQLAEGMSVMSCQGDTMLARMGLASQEIISQWSLNRFVHGALAAIDYCNGVSRGFNSFADRVLLAVWKGRYRPL